MEELLEQLTQAQTALQQAQARPNTGHAQVDSYRIPKIPPFLITDPVI